MIVLTPAEMRKMDNESIADGFTSSILMEMAGRGTAELIDKNYESNELQVSIFCGKGNNGGDGFVVARFLNMWGYNVQIFFTGEAKELKEVNYTNYKIAKLQNIPIKKVKKIDNEIKLKTKKSDIIVDALLGTGIEGKPRGIYGELIDIINTNKHSLVVAIDVPSGVNALSGEVAGKAVKADLTATMAYYKTGLLLNPGQQYCGEIEVIDLGMVDKSFKKINYNHFVLNNREAAKFLGSREPTGHKGTFGKILVVGGSKNMPGAPALVGEAALKSGAGLVKTALPDIFDPKGLNYKKEIIYDFLKSDGKQITKKAFENIRKSMEKMDVLALGPGLGQSKEISELVRKIINDINKPIVLDADGINALKDLDILNNCGDNLIMTPHPGEMSRLIEKSVKEIKKNKVEISRKFASEYGVNLILKGATTIIALPNGKIYFNVSGNSGLATAGSGDVLTGIAASLLAQGIKPAKSAILAPYLHGKAGDKAKEDLTEYSIIASDLIKYLPKIFKELKKY